VMLTIPMMVATSSVADSPETPLEELEGMVTVPGTDKDVQIADIPIITAISAHEGQDLYTKPISPGMPQIYQYINSGCSSPETANSLEAACTSTDREHMYDSPTLCSSPAILAENQHLKGMLMAHLDIIQQQSETILSKDRLLKALKEETGLLRQKLQRMTRRLKPEGEIKKTLVLGKSDLKEDAERGKKRSQELSGEERPAKKLHTGHRMVAVASGGGDQCLDGVGIAERGDIRTQGETDRHERRQTVCHTDSVDELRDEFCQQTSPEVPQRVNRSVEERTGRKEELQEEEEEEEEELDRKGTERRLVERNNQHQTKASGKGKKGRSNVASLETETGRHRQGRQSSQASASTPPVHTKTSHNLYYVGCRNDQQGVSTDDQLTEVPALQRGVEVPSWREDVHHYALFVPNKISLKKSKDKEVPTWRIKSTNPLYTVEGTESVNDSIYLRRHDKQEKDEKQRKRWDQQRMRQELQLQKLRARQERQAMATHSKSLSAEIEPSLLPAMEAATHIAVEDTVPVSAFGRPLPDLQPTQFCLPWL